MTTRRRVFAANWKMHLGPTEAARYMDAFLAAATPSAGCLFAFFPPAVSIEAVASKLSSTDHVVTGAQNVYWEEKGAYTGELSIALVHDAGARAALVGHSERRHLFGETDAETHKKVTALSSAGFMVVLCVGEKLLERERDETEAVVTRQLRAALTGVSTTTDLVIAYEPVWAIGTGKNATPSDAAVVHAAIRRVLVDLGFSRDLPILYGGSVNGANAAALLNEDEVDGLLVGGASLDAIGWARICALS